MNKEEFLRVLREKLSILDEREMQDILSEYEQHIDMKAAGAMTEEEAIADFGNLDDLAADILGAYHVRADYGKESAETDQRDGWWKRFRSWINRMVCRFREGLLQFGAWSRRKWKNCCTFWTDLFQRCFRSDTRRAAAQPDTMEGQLGQTWNGGFQMGEKKEQSRMENGMTGAKNPGAKSPGADETEGWSGRDEAHSIVRNSGRPHPFLHGMKKGIQGFLAGCSALLLACWKLLIWGIKWTWNIGWVLAGGIIGMGACFCLFFLGLLFMLGMQGYPVAGVTIGMVGVSMCLASLMGLCFTFMVRHTEGRREEKAHASRRPGTVWRKRKKAALQDAEEEEAHA